MDSSANIIVILKYLACRKTLITIQNYSQKYYAVEILLQVVYTTCHNFMHACCYYFIYYCDVSSVEGYSDTEGTIIIIRTHLYDE